MQTLPTPTTPGHDAPHLDLSRIAQDLQIRKIHVENVVQMLDEGNTVPFITRYRKERTGGLNEEVIRTIEDRVAHLRQLADRKQTILKSIEGQGKLTEELRAAIVAADSPKRLEDLYLPYKPKKRTLATVARERGLEALALAIWNRDPAVANLAEVLTTMVAPEKELPTPEAVREGAQHILAELIAETADVRAAVRAVLWDTGKLATKKSEKLGEADGLDYKDYFQFTEAVRQIPPHRVLAINRGEKENVLQTRLEADVELVKNVALDKLPLADHPHAEFLRVVAEDALNRLLVPSLEREIRRELTHAAEDHAVHVFARNLRSLLLQRPLRGRRVLALDPGFRTGCKVAVLDEYGNLLDHGVVFPHSPQNKKSEAKAKLEQLIRKHQVPVLAIGNGTACRETEEVVSDLIADLEKRRKGEEEPGSPKNGASISVPPGLGVSPTEGATQPTAATEPVPQPAPAPVAVEPTPAAPAPETTPTPAPSPVAEVPAPPAVVESPAPTPDTAPPAATAEQTTAPAAVAPAPAPEAVAPTPPPPPAEPLPEAPPELAYIIVNEAGASHYSASAVGREEFPDYDATLRGTISIGRRLQDPLSELVKIEPQNIGVGLYQHDVNPRQLKESLDHVVESCVNYVGVDLNTASVPLLRHVSGLNQLTAREVVEYRKQHGPFQSRDQLLQVPGIGDARYTQAAGFLKIGGGNNPLDRTWIHPESYDATRKLLADLGFGPETIEDKARTEELGQKLHALPVEEVSNKLQLGVPTVVDILEALRRPGRDPREDLPPPIFKRGILKLEDLQPGMELKGTVLNVVDFGAFIDIGLKDSGLVHISQMANRYVKNPYEVVAVGDVVTVWVLTVDQQRRRVSLTMIRPGTERKPPERRPQQPRGEQQPQQQGQGQQQQRGGRPQRGRRPPPQRGGPAQGGGPGSQGGAPADAQPAHGGHRQGGRDRGHRPPPQPQEQPRPRKPQRALPRPKLTRAALEGDTPLRTFSELEAFFAAKKEPDAPPAPPPAPPAPAASPVAPVAPAVEGTEGQPPAS